MKECVDFIAIPEKVWMAIKEAEYEYDAEVVMKVKDISI
jgi:hypothetical protein